MFRRSIFFSVTPFITCLALSNSAILAQSGLHSRTLITQSINESKSVTLRGNTHPAVSLANDLGPVSGNVQFEHMFLQLKRSPEQQEELKQFINSLHNPQSTNYHKWLTAAQFGQRFGLAQEDVNVVKNWLASHGFVVNAVYPNQVIDFSGSASAVRSAFHTEIHNLNVNGKRHMANVKDPEIPAALASTVVGPVVLHDFKPHPLSRPRPDFTFFNANGQFQAVVPVDLQTIYNFGPLYQAGLSGQGQTIAVLEESDLFAVGDFNIFRKVLGLARRYPHGQLVQVHPQFGTAGNCADPGPTGDNSESEATIDTEWATAAAPNAKIMLASCSDTEFNFGIFIALENMLTNGTTPPAVISDSFGIPETDIGADGNAFVDGLYQLAVSEGVSLFVGTGDSGGANEDQNQTSAEHGINVNGLASTPDNVAVGGTDFSDTFQGLNSIYWNSTNDSNFGSALSYVPEIPWNDSCAGELITIFAGFAAPYGGGGFCNSSTAIQNGFLNTVAASGGPSGCAFGAPAIQGVVSGDCAGYAKPAYQTVIAGNPSDGVRDMPDISLFASNAFWGHYYVTCYSNQHAGGSSCLQDPSLWAGFGGTSISTPIMAGIQALINQATGSVWGNPNFVYYPLAAIEYGATGNNACNSNLGNGTDPGCVFYDITAGDITVNCLPLTSNGTTVGTFSCFYPATNPGTNGVLSTSNTAYQPAFSAQVGWDFATGIGTVNAANLVANWPGSSFGVQASAAVKTGN